MQEIQKRKKSIKYYQVALKGREGDANAQNLLGKYLSELARLTNSQEDYQGALAHLNISIELDPENVIYLCDRVTLYRHFKKTQEAIRDFQVLNQLRVTHPSNSAWSKFQMMNTLKDLTRLKEIQNTIKSLRERRALSEDFLCAFNSLRNVAEGLVVQVDRHSEELEKVWAVLRKLEEKAENISPQDMPEVIRLVEELGIRVDDQDKRILKIDEQVEEHKEVLETAGVKDLANLKKELEALKIRDPQLYTYTKTAYWAKLNMFGAYRHLSTGLVAAGGNPGIGEVVANKVVKKVASTAAGFMKSVPIVGGLFEFTDKMIDSLFDWLEGKKVEEKCSIINKIIRKHCPMEDDLSLMTSKISLALANFPGKAEVIKQNPRQASQQKNWLTIKCEKIHQKYWPGIERDPAAIEAIKDVILLFSYLIVNYEAVLESQEDLHDQVKRILKDNKLDKMLAGIGVNGTCKLCIKIGLDPRIGKNLSTCFTCKQMRSGGLKCSFCKVKYCKQCV